MIESPLLAILFLFGSSLMTGVMTALQRIGKSQAELFASGQKGVGNYFFKKSHRDLLTFALSFSKNIYLICFTITAFGFAYQFLPEDFTPQSLILTALCVLGISIVSDSIFKVLCLMRPETFFQMSCQLVSLLLLPLWPLSILLFKGLRTLFPISKESTNFRIKDKILEILHDSEFAPHIETNDQKLIVSVVTFKERIAREVMVPRIDMFTLSSETSMKEALEAFVKEGYSRIPVWKESVDHIIGALYYKDLLKIYSTTHDLEKQLATSIEKSLKPVVYTPETKKISQLLQEFRSKQIHMAIVVDEYGGTEGIVTIEDILEELVGEIADEYDYDEEALFTPCPREDGSSMPKCRSSPLKMNWA
jgi:putative hemolysin